MFDRYPRQNQKAGVVGEEADVLPPRFRAPTEIPIAATQVTRCRTPCQASDRPPLSPDQILELLADRLLIAQVMMLFHQAIEQRFVPGAPHLLKLDRFAADLVAPGSGSCRSAWPPAAGVALPSRIRRIRNRFRLPFDWSIMHPVMRNGLPGWPS
jgi:hypothetical protein